MKKISKFTLILILTILLASCAPARSYRRDGITYFCIDNVEYIAIASYGLSGHFKTDGSLYTCTEK